MSTTIYPLVIFVVFATIKIINHKLHILFDGEELLEEDTGKSESKGMITHFGILLADYLILMKFICLLSNINDPGLQNCTWVRFNKGDAY